MAEAASSPKPGNERVQRIEPRPPLTLEELLELLQKQELLSQERAHDIALRATTLRSAVLKERVGSVRSQAAARYDVTPAEIVNAASFAHPIENRGKIDEDCVAAAIGRAANIPHRKLDPLRIDNDLIVKTLPRPFARHHSVIAVARRRGSRAARRSGRVRRGRRRSPA